MRLGTGGRGPCESIRAFMVECREKGVHVGFGDRCVCGEEWPCTNTPNGRNTDQREGSNDDGSK